MVVSYFCLGCCWICSPAAWHRCQWGWVLNATFRQRQFRCWFGASAKFGTKNRLPARKAGSTVSPTMCRSRMNNCLHHGLVVGGDQHKPIMTAVFNNQSELGLIYQNRFHWFEPVLEATLGILMLAYMFLTMLGSWRSDRMMSLYSRKEDVHVEATLNQR